jgi:Fanconi anemia group M protein
MDVKAVDESDENGKDLSSEELSNKSYNKSYDNSKLIRKLAEYKDEGPESEYDSDTSSDDASGNSASSDDDDDIVKAKLQQTQQIQQTQQAQPIQPREYQRAIADKIIRERKNTLIILGTGLGKTLTAALVAKHFLEKGKKVLFLAPTRPLVEQHGNRLKEYLGIEGAIVTGHLPSLRRRELYKERLVISTPQCVSNDSQRWDFLSDFALVIFDEAHRSVGRYAYTHIAAIAKQNGSLIIGMTASPGGKAERIRAIMDALSIDNIEIRTEKEKDVKPYVQPLKLEWIHIDMSPELRKATDILIGILDEKSKILSAFGISITKKTARGRLSQIYRALIEHKNIAALGHFATFYNAFHAIELLESEGPYAYHQFITRLKGRKRRVDPRFFRVDILVRDKEHPKMEKLLEILSQRKGKKIIIFAQYRDQVNHIVDILNKNGFSARRFVGKKEGSQREQKETLDAFRRGEFDILVASSIGEEGIDIPAADTAIFYEPIPSEIRTIQRRGRVARLKGGEVIILVTRGTRDEIFKWVAAARERTMHKIIASLKEKKKKTKREKKEKKEEKNKEKLVQKKISEFFE